MGCLKCPSYSTSIRKCTRGLSNPKSIKEGVREAKTFGILHICEKDGMRKRVFERMKREGEMG